ncbi:helix-turn-helix domain-containing protein [Paenibacillus eucommiae]|uniref:AraC-like DNA-binding protein/quercetin dioxygenase-like cupin family protein n=1 Tax=Paenibacillus eucommiae TaxID=1355755 RepID=A0ABS4IMK9_9BACL|nr:AraC family transcriptional regulator [Paenibacillus eucommiae]MBP1988745.1 AraC-like DNA-binding protein/quercetin dioxygenase-like cupin family protein [Paenibacillus eucommiae]
MDTEIHFSNTIHTLQITGCHFGVRPGGWSYPRHHHHLFELLYCWEGEVTQVVEGHEIKLARGEWLLVKPGIKHSTYNDSEHPYTFFNIHFNIDDEELRSLLTPYTYRHLTRSSIQQTKLPAYLKEIEALLQNQLTDSRNYEWEHNRGTITLNSIHKLFLQGQLLFMIREVIILLSGFALAGAAANAVNEKGLSSTSQVDVAHEIEGKLRSSVCSKGVITDIAKEQNLSRSQCSKIFTQVYGMSPRQYLSDIKLNQAKKLLLSSELTIEAISDELGFTSLSHFSRQFKRWTGVSPNQFRPKHEGGKS